MRIDLKIDDSKLQLWGTMAQKKTAYGAVKAINDTAKDLQPLERANLRKDFTVRQPTFMDRQVAIIKPFASVGRGLPYAEISVGQKPRLLLSGYERGFERRPFVGKHVAVPVLGGPARPTLQTSVPAEYSFKSLSIIKVREGKIQYAPTGRGGTLRPARERVKGISFKKHVTRYGQVQYKGAHRTFVITHANVSNMPFGGVFQRVGSKRRDIRLVYGFHGPSRMRERLHFVATAEAHGSRLLREHMETQLIDAMGHAWRAR